MWSTIRTIANLTGIGLMFMISMQGCMTNPASLSARDALALSASALSGSESYQFAGEVSVLDPGGVVGGRAAYKGEVTMHGKLDMQWKTPTGISQSSINEKTITYRPLQLLESVKATNATISYVEEPSSDRPIRMQIKLDDVTAKERVVKQLKEEFTLLRADKDLLRGDPVKAEEVLRTSEARLEKALTTLKVSTVCQWTANPKSWFPSRLKEETELSYDWNGKPCKEKRISETNFILKGQGGTMKK
ncbi:hypothetical protein [Cohnella mopanensis]|uniref:hypothetical protein n=1 Tax=Cohnella mopanensis TaxID=2911966 RepID=UPI001EF76162|nr:hypothetical protein [Cohnella mopanensis]